MIIAGIDAGNFEVKFVTDDGFGSFSSAIGEYRERNLVSTHGDGMIFEYNGRRGFAGTLAEMESEFAGAIMGDSKAHDDAKLRILLACHRLVKLSRDETFKLVVGQTVSRHTDSEKQAIINALVGRHDITVNNERKILTIEDVAVAAEGGAALWSSPQNGKVRIIDVGSATVNCVTFVDCRYIDRDSFTLNFGINTLKTNDMKELARGIATNTSKKWHPADNVIVAGGVAKELTTHIRDYYPNARTVVPNLNGFTLEPKFANAVGFHAIAKAVYRT